MNILVTGGAGFIGSHFVMRHVSQQPKDTVIVLDALTYAADEQRLASVRDAMTFVKGDIVDRALVTQLVERFQIDVIVNFAAETHVDRSIRDASPFLHSNVLGVQSIIDVCRQFPHVLLVQISTDEVYGDLTDDDAPRNPSDSLTPSSPYAASKAAGDLLLLAAVRTFGIRCRIVRCTNNYGPHQATEKFIPTVIRAALSDAPIPVYGEGHNKRDWLYVTDHCDAIELTLAADDLDNRIVHVSAGHEQRNIDVVQQILHFLGKPQSLVTTVSDRPGHDWRYALDSSMIRGLGWKPQVDFSEGLARTVEWYRKAT